MAFNPTALRCRAEKIRKIATLADEPNLKASLLQLADSWDHLADHCAELDGTAPPRVAGDAAGQGTATH